MTTKQFKIPAAKAKCANPKCKYPRDFEDCYCGTCRDQVESERDDARSEQAHYDCVGEW
jgi:hypothetical protein